MMRWWIVSAIICSTLLWIVIDYPEIARFLAGVALGAAGLRAYIMMSGNNDPLAPARRSAAEPQ